MGCEKCKKYGITCKNNFIDVEYIRGAEIRIK
jgi:hypothetical protein